MYAAVGAEGVEGVQPAIYRYDADVYTVSLVAEGEFQQPE